MSPRRPSALSWYVGRLRAMSASEVGHRVMEQAKRRLSRLQRPGWERFATEGGPPRLPGLAETLAANDTPALRRFLRDAGAAILAGRFEALGVAWPTRDPADLFPAAVWRLDPVSGESWPGAERYCFDISYRQAGVRGDVKYVWEFNRLQFLHPLAALVALEGDRAALAAIEAAVSSWMAANPPFRGIAWASGIELSLRAVSLLLVSTLCGEALSPRTRDRIRTILAAHLHWLRRYPSRFSSANNHLVAELLGEFLIATAMPELPGAGGVAAHALSALEREAGLQILPDGVPAEQSPTYGAFSAEMLALAGQVAAAAGRPMAEAATERLGRFAGFIDRLADTAGRCPAIGDDDEGRVVNPCLGDEPAYAVSVAACCRHDDLPPRRTIIAGNLRNALLPGPATGADAAAADGAWAFPQGGYTVVRERRGGRALRLVMDHGPLGYLAIAAHGHADTNAFTLDLDERAVLIDPGTFLYGAGGAWRTWLRGTRAHNTLCVAETNASLPSGPFNWSHKALGRRIMGSNERDWSVTGEHDGYAKRFGVTHRRTIRAEGEGVLIRDRLLPEPGRLPVEVVFQGAPDLDATLDDRGAVLARDGEPVLRIAFDAPGEVRVETGGAGHEGWVSPRFGVRVPAPRIAWRGVVPRAGLATRLTWSDHRAS